MKRSLDYSALLLFLLLIFHSSISSARTMVHKQGRVEVNVNGINSQEASEQKQATESVDELMGLELCDNGDGDCFNRRMIAEAHLDYIYTQHHKP